LVRVAQKGDAQEARRINSALQPIWDLFRNYTSYRVVHEMNAQLGLCHVSPPPPILPVCEQARLAISRVLRDLPEEILGRASNS